jgi:hypothetical protein
VWKRFLQSVKSFFQVWKNLFFKFFEIIKFEKVCGREFFKLLRILAFKFENVCGRNFFELLKNFSFQD